MMDPVFEFIYNEVRQEIGTAGQDFFHGIMPVRREQSVLLDQNEKLNAQIASRLRLGREANDLSEQAFLKALDKISAFIYAMESSFDPNEERIEYETLIEDSIVVTFKSRPKMRLNIYFDEESLGDDNPEESYLLYEKKGRMTLISDTIKNNVDLIRQILFV